MTASVRRNEDQQIQSPSPSKVIKMNLTHPVTIEKWKLDWLGVEGDEEKNSRFLCKACRICGQRVAEVVVNPAQINYSADFIMGSENIKKYLAFRHQATKQHAIAL